MFGVRKRAACIDLLSDLTSAGNASDFLTRASRDDYFQWLREQRTSDDRPHHTEVPWPGFVDYRSPPGRAVNAVLGRSAAQRLGPRSRAVLGAVTLEAGADRNLEQRRKLRRFIFHWATDRAISKYPRPEMPSAIP